MDAEKRAAQRVFNTAELLENVLVQGGSPDSAADAHPEALFVFQRVNHFWRQLISNSPTLRQAMGLDYRKLDTQVERTNVNMYWLQFIAQRCCLKIDGSWRVVVKPATLPRVAEYGWPVAIDPKATTGLKIAVNIEQLAT